MKCTYLLQIDVFGQILHFTPLFIAELIEILPYMYVSSDIMVSSTFKQVLTGFQVDPSCLTIDKVNLNFIQIRRHFIIPYRLSTIWHRFSSIQAISIALMTILTLKYDKTNNQHLICMTCSYYNMYLFIATRNKTNVCMIVFSF